MEPNIQSLYSEWQFVRRCTTQLIQDLEDKHLDAVLPRKGLNTFRKHFKEMTLVQQDYIRAIETGEMEFNSIPDTDIPGNVTKEELLARCALLDKKLESVLNLAKPGGEIQWFGQGKLLPFHLAALIAHEAMHIGQIIAFCYSLDIKIPQFLKDNWGLSGE